GRLLTPLETVWTRCGQHGEEGPVLPQLGVWGQDRDMPAPPPSSTGLPLEQLAHQLRWHWENHLRPRLSGMTDQEYHWEPAAGAWGLRTVGTPAQEYPGAVRAGRGDWVVDFAF